VRTGVQPTCRLQRCTSGPELERPPTERPGSWGLHSSHPPGGEERRGEERRGEEKGCEKKRGGGGKERREGVCRERVTQLLKEMHKY